MAKYFFLLAFISFTVAAWLLWPRGSSGNGTEFSTTTQEFSEDFEEEFTVEEAMDIDDSTNEHWWVSSGGYFVVTDGIGRTNWGMLPKGDPWQVRYAQTKAPRTSGGRKPQNLFRLVQRNQWLNLEQEVYFNIRSINKNADDTRNQSNGVFLLNRYQDEDTLYYTGVRVDGAVVVKRKFDGVYHTLAYEQVYEGTYSRDGQPNLIPEDQWIGLRSRVISLAGSVEIKVYLDTEDTGEWELIAHVIDDPKTLDNASVIDQSGYAGLRSDFMDVGFDRYTVRELE